MASNRVYDKSTGLNLQTYQRNAASSGLRHEVITIPSDTAASFGNYFTISLRETNIFVHQLLLQFTANAVAGMTTNPRYTPANFWISRIELFSSGTVIDTIYPSELHILNNLFWDDADRMSINKAAGHYANVAQRVALAAATSTYYVNLRSFIDQLHYPLLTANHNLQLRVYMDTLANNTVASSGTATNSDVTACNLIARVSRIEQGLASQLLQEMSVRPFDNFFHQTRLFSTTVTCSSTSTSSRLILSPIVGSVPFMFFTVRSTSNLVKDDYFNYSAVTSFAFLDGAGQNIVGGSQLPASLVQDTLMREWTLSNFCAENNSSLLSAYLTGFNGSNAYLYSFSSDPITAFKTGSLLGARRFNGTELLEIYFSATGTYQVDCYFFTENILTQSPSGISITSV
jgi:hypothetical protein